MALELAVEDESVALALTAVVDVFGDTEGGGTLVVGVSGRKGARFVDNGRVA